MIGLNVTHKGLILVAVPAILNLFILGGLYYLWEQQKIQAKVESRADAFNRLSNDTIQRFFNSGVISYRYMSTHAGNLVKSFELNKMQSEDNFRELLSLESDPRRIEKVRHLRVMNRRIMGAFEAFMKASAEGRDGMMLFEVPEIRFEVQFLTKQFVAEFDDLDRTRQALQQTNLPLSGLKLFIAAGVLANVALSIIMAHFFGHNIADRLKVMINNTLRLASNQQLTPTVRGSDEIAMLDHVYHEMAGVLQEALRLETAITEQALDIICSVNDKRRFTAINPACELIWGFPPGDLLGRTIDSITSDNLAEVLPTEPQTQEGMQLIFENRIKAKDGRIVHMHWSAFWNPAERTYFCVAHDITDRKQAEDLLRESETRIRTIIENLPMGLLILDELGYVEVANHQDERLLQLSTQEMTGRHVSFVLEQRNDAIKEYMDSLLSECYQHTGERFCVRKDSTKVPIELFVNDIFFQGRRKFLVVLLDISERRRIETARKEFVHMVSHDLKTPINSVESIMELLLAGALGKLDVEERAAAESTRQELRRLLTLINGLLDMEKMQAGLLELEREVNSSLIIVQKAVAAVADITGSAVVEMMVETEDCELFCDADRLSQVLVYFVLDALRRDPPPTKVCVAARRIGERDEKLRFEMKAYYAGATLWPNALFLSDSEGNSDPAQLARFGLWLSICAAVVRAHNGVLCIVEEQENAVSYGFELPLPKEE